MTGACHHVKRYLNLPSNLYTLPYPDEHNHVESNCSLCHCKGYKEPFSLFSTVPIVSYSGLKTLPNQDKQKKDRERVVILGSGWAGQLSPPHPCHSSSYSHPADIWTRAVRLRSLPPTFRQETPNCRRLPPLLLRFHAPAQQYRRWHTQTPHCLGADTKPAVPERRVCPRMGLRCRFHRKTITVEESALGSGPHRALAGDQDTKSKGGKEKKNGQ